MNAQKGDGGIAVLFILTPNLERAWVVNATLRPFCCLNKDSVAITQKAV